MKPWNIWNVNRASFSDFLFKLLPTSSPNRKLRYQLHVAILFTHIALDQFGLPRFRGGHLFSQGGGKDFSPSPKGRRPAGLLMTTSGAGVLLLLSPPLNARGDVPPSPPRGRPCARLGCCRRPMLTTRVNQCNSSKHYQKNVFDMYQIF